MFLKNIYTYYYNANNVQKNQEKIIMFRAEIKAHSIDERGNELLTVSCTFPRIIVAEMNTHRMLSKNTSSSRAIPFEKMMQSV